MKAFSFSEAFDFMTAFHCAFDHLDAYLGEAAMEVLSDAINLYAQNPENWGCDEECDMAALMALEFHRCGFNHLLPEHDVTLKFLRNTSDQDG